MSEFDRFRNVDSFQCNVCPHFDRLKVSCVDDVFCTAEVERAYRQGLKDAIKGEYEQGAKDFAKYLIDKEVDNYSDVVDLVAEFLKGEEK